jgi:protein-disulfide isomerase
MNAKMSRMGRIVLMLMPLALAATAPTVAQTVNQAPISIEVQKHILNSPGTAVAGSSHANVTVVEYFDYNCPFCRKLAPAFRGFLQTDQDAAVIYKDWPIFGGASVYAAKAALAAQWQGKYLQAHEALITAPRLSENDQVDAALDRSGIDIGQLKKDLDTHGAAIDALLTRNDSEARALGLRGTPGILVGRQVVSGVRDLRDLQAAVAGARSQK